MSAEQENLVSPDMPSRQVVFKREEGSTLGPHLQNPEIVRILQEILDLRRELLANTATDGNTSYYVFAARELIVLTKTQVLKLMRGLIEIELKAQRLVIKRDQASLVSWGKIAEDRIREPLAAEELLTILMQYRQVLTKSLDRAEKST